MRVCRKCGEEKSPEHFYADPSRDCKACRKTAARQYRAANIDRVRAYDRLRGQNPERKERVRLHTKSLSKEYKKEVTRRERFAHPQKNAARRAVGRALRTGQLIRGPCEKCGATKTHGHHEDYSQPLNVQWLCDPCHKARHREINEERRRRMAE